MWNWGAGYGWGMAILGMLMMVVFWGGILAAIVFGVRALSGSRASGDGALAALRRRLAAGEITPEEFERIRALLQS